MEARFFYLVGAVFVFLSDLLTSLLLAALFLAALVKLVKGELAVLVLIPVMVWISVFVVGTWAAAARRRDAWVHQRLEFTLARVGIVFFWWAFAQGAIASQEMPAMVFVTVATIVVSINMLLLFERWFPVSAE